LNILVYGTLKEGYSNNRLLQGHTKRGDFIVRDYKLYNCGFPVAWPSEGETIKGEIWDIGDSQETLRRLDGLESEGSMYNRTDVIALDAEGNEHPAQMYVGHPKNWSIDRLRECPKNESGEYVWSRG
jgi:gamma-glutamylcyclotransferase (GGCT)/AIG2-like uncharacterized protein YtfP